MGEGEGGDRNEEGQREVVCDNLSVARFDKKKYTMRLIIWEIFAHFSSNLATLDNLNLVR